ncbi:MAG: PQQ-binding-like beta-propeller repeat protein [Phycisphaeraceae bacterium]|nr:PQQ-binding-like beta-propeller repeat protein [Phycisphaeraceae bacterium]
MTTILASLTIALALGAPAPDPPPQPTWPMLAGGPAHPGVCAGRPPQLNSPLWIVSVDQTGAPLLFHDRAGVIVGDQFVYALAEREGECVLAAIEPAAGHVAWTCAIPPPAFNSWSTPTYHRGSDSVLVASDLWVTAIDATEGSVRWQTELHLEIVNASPIVTEGLVGDRAFIVDSDSFFDEGRLYCLNVSQTSEANPFEPGQVVWSVEIGSTVGATPAYADGVVYVAIAGEHSPGRGRIKAYPALVESAPNPIWTFSNVKNEGFYGGVAVRDEPQGSAVYAASYAFFGERASANLVKLDAQTGTLIWSVDCNRTSSIPIVLDDDRIVLSTGIQGYGSVPSIQVFSQSEAGASLIWDSALATWMDDGDGKIEPGEFVPLGGWDHQPIVLGRAEHATLIVGEPANPPVGPYAGLRTLRVPNVPPRAEDLQSLTELAGCTPARAKEILYSVGVNGLAAFGPTGPRPDVDGNGIVEIDDLYAWEQGLGERDVNQDGAVDSRDRDALLGILRKDEVKNMAAPRR